MPTGQFVRPGLTPDQLRAADAAFHPELSNPFATMDDVSYSGFWNRAETSLSFDSTSRIFSISPIDGTFTAFAGKAPIIFSSTQNITIPNVYGQHFIALDIDGTFKSSMVVWNLLNDAAACGIVYWDGTGGAIYDERHSYRRNKEWHLSQHLAIHTLYERGLDIASISASLFSINSGRIWDEDLNHEIGTSTICRIWHRDSSLARMHFTDSTTLAKISGTNLRYDANGILTNVSIGSYVNYWVYATNDIIRPIYVITGQNIFSNITDARNENPAFVSLPSMISAEWKLLYRITFRQIGTTPTYVENADYRNASVIVNGGSYSPATAANVVFTSYFDLTSGNVQTAIEDLYDLMLPKSWVDTVDTSGATTHAISSSWAYSHNHDSTSHNLQNKVDVTGGYILGQSDVETYHTLGALDTTVVVDYLLGNAHFLDRATNNPATISVVLNNWPSGNNQYAALTLLVKCGTNINFSLPAGFPAVTLTASKTNAITLYSYYDSHAGVVVKRAVSYDVF